MSDSNLKPNINLKPKLNPLIASLPDYLKDPKNYLKIQKLIISSLRGKCNHNEVVEWAECAKCQERFLNKRNLLKKLGFKNPAQYLAWQKIHEEIKKRFPLADWSKLNEERKLEKKII